MILESVAASAVSLVASFLVDAGKTLAGEFGKDLSDHMKNKIKELYETIKRKFANYSYASESLKRFEEKPEDKERQIIMESILRESFMDDPKFQKSLNQLITEINQMKGDIIQSGNGVIANDHSMAAGENGIVAGGNITINNNK